jgi:hypothetical protein
MSPAERRDTTGIVSGPVKVQQTPRIKPTDHLDSLRVKSQSRHKNSRFTGDYCLHRPASEQTMICIQIGRTIVRTFSESARVNEVTTTGPSLMANAFPQGTSAEGPRLDRTFY